MKNKKVLFILTISLSLLLLSGSLIFASTKFFPEPAKTKDVPSDVTWNSTLGCYVSNDYDVDPSSGKFVERDPKTRPSSELKGSPVSQIDQWITNHKDSNSEIDKALLKYNEESKKYISIKNYYDPKDDKGLSILTNLGVKNLPELLSRIESNDYWSGTLMYAVEEITKTNNGHISVNSDERSTWIRNIKDKAKNAKDIIEKNSSDLNNTEVKNLGIFATPYLIDMVNKGNTKALSLLPDLSESNLISKSELANKDISYWNSWAANNKENLEILKNIGNK